MDKRAYSVNADGTEICTIYIKDLTTGTLLAETIPNTYGGVYGHAGASGRYDHLKEIASDFACIIDKVGS